jgi:pSer/pThr/pTyr-binding forkhead associated (FHA) protein
MALVPDNDFSALAVFTRQSGPDAGEPLPVRSPVLSIGHGSQNDLVLDDDSVSKTHARLEYDAGDWRLTDLGSTNGTYIDGVRLAPEVPMPINSGATARFGAVALLFQAEEAADPEAARARYAPPPAATPLAQRSRGPRLPLWLFVLILIVLAVIVFFLVGGTHGGWITGTATPLLRVGGLPGAP